MLDNISVEDIFEKPALIEGKTPNEIRELVKDDPRWIIERLSKGSHAGTGQIVREINLITGNATGRLFNGIQVAGIMGHILIGK